ncbi:MAG: TIGR03086 family metal-binding protein [Actinomycetia bacterium]|nr:TIGR03086 family metal-binding protein [Actinomycetes bacterium]
MTAQTVHDPRPSFTRALDQAEQQAANVRPDELDNRTPCSDFDVRALLGHIVGVLTKLARVGAGEDASEVPDVIDGIDDGAWPVAFRRARGEVDRVWADDALLEQAVTLPWATLPGRVALDAYTHEFTVHGWDLAHATGRLDQLDPSLALEALVAFSEFAPPDTRSEHGPFGPVISISDDAEVYSRLAAYVGRRP